MKSSKKSECIKSLLIDCGKIEQLTIETCNIQSYGIDTIVAKNTKSLKVSIKVSHYYLKCSTKYVAIKLKNIFFDKFRKELFDTSVKQTKL